MSKEQAEDKKPVIAVKKKGDTLAFLERKDPLRTNANLYVPSNSNPFMVATNGINTNAFAKATTVNTLSSLLSTLAVGISSLLDMSTQTLAISNIAPSGANVGDSTMDPTQSVTIQLASTISLLSPGNNDGRIMMDTRYYNLKIRSSMFIYGPNVIMSTALQVENLNAKTISILNLGAKNLTISSILGNTNSSIIIMSTLVATSLISTNRITAVDSVFSTTNIQSANISSMNVTYTGFSTMSGSTLSIMTLSTISTGYISSLSTNTISVTSSLSASTLTATGSSVLGQCRMPQLQTPQVLSQYLNVSVSSNIELLIAHSTIVTSSIVVPNITSKVASSLNGRFSDSLACDAETTSITFSGSGMTASTMNAAQKITTPLVYTTQFIPIVTGDPITFQTLTGSVINTTNLNSNLVDNTEGYFSTFHSNKLYTGILSTPTVFTDSIQHINSAGNPITFDKFAGTSISTTTLSTITLNHNVTDNTTGYFKTFNADTINLNTLTSIGDHITFDKFAGTSISTTTLSTITLNHNVTDNTTGYFKTLNADTINLNTITSIGDHITVNKLVGSLLSTNQLSMNDIAGSVVLDTNLTNYKINATPDPTPAASGNTTFASLKIIINGEIWRIPIQKP